MVGDTQTVPYTKYQYSHMYRSNYNPCKRSKYLSNHIPPSRVISNEEALLIKGKVSKFTLENFGCVKNVAI
jgi:hypothetical protein